MQVAIDLPILLATLGAVLMGIVIPILGWWVRGLLQRVDDLEERLNRDAQRLGEGLSNFKLEVSQRYVTSEAVRLVETRLTEHLNRIEKKLDDREREARHP